MLLDKLVGNAFGLGDWRFEWLLCCLVEQDLQKKSLIFYNEQMVKVAEHFIYINLVVNHRLES